MPTPDGGARIGVIGHGYSVPAGIRQNDDPIFAWLRQNDPNFDKYFFGYNERRVLGPGERLITHMLASAEAALAMSGVLPAQIDLLLGFESVSEYSMPNGIAQLHQMLGLPKSCWIIPLNVEYSNFNAGLVIADAMIRSGQVRNALVVSGGNWTRYVDYHSSPSVSAGDGAGAAVVGRTSDASTFRVVDFETITQTSLIVPPAADSSVATDPNAPPVIEPTYGGMFVGTDVVAAGATKGSGLYDDASLTQPYFHLTTKGMTEFSTFGVTAPVQVVQTLLRRNTLSGSQVTITAHQTSQLLLQAWNNALRPRPVSYTHLTLPTNREV